MSILACDFVENDGGVIVRERSRRHARGVTPPSISARACQARIVDEHDRTASSYPCLPPQEPVRTGNIERERERERSVSPIDDYALKKDAQAVRNPPSTNHVHVV